MRGIFQMVIMSRHSYDVEYRIYKISQLRAIMTPC